MTPFLHQVALEIERARQKHPRLNSFHEGYAVLLEEVDEFWEQVKRQRADQDPEVMLAELVQIAAMAARVAEDCKLIDPTYDDQRAATERVHALFLKKLGAEDPDHPWLKRE